jgi:transposase
LNLALLVANLKEGFETIINWIKELSRENKMNHATVCIKPTGNYWFESSLYSERE